MTEDLTATEMPAEGLTRRAILARSAALAGTAVTGATLTAGATSALARPRGTTLGRAPGSAHLPPAPPAPWTPTQRHVQADALSHDDVSFTPSRWTFNGVAIPPPGAFFFHWSWITGLRGRGPILLVRQFTAAGGPLGALRHVELQPGLFRTGIDLSAGHPALSGVPAMPYQQIAGDPDNLGGPIEHTFEMSNPDNAGGQPGLLLRLGTRGFRWMEGNGGSILNVRGQHMPRVAVTNPPGMWGPYFSAPGAICQGTYLGQPVWYLGGWDHAYNIALLGATLQFPFYQACVGAGIHPNGQREMFAVYQQGNSAATSTGFGIYFKEGHEPIISENVQQEGVWVQLDTDHSKIAAKEMTWRFDQDGRQAEIHMESQYTTTNGAGNGEIFGTWHEKHSNGNFVRHLMNMEHFVKPGAAPISGDYTPPS
jgi:hypothetical protein